jgi:hypothetical protein
MRRRLKGRIKQKKHSYFFKNITFAKLILQGFKKNKYTSILKPYRKKRMSRKDTLNGHYLTIRDVAQPG